MKRLLWILVLVLGAGVLAACGSSADPSPEITLEMNEFGFVPEEIELKVGQEVTIHLVNVGEIEHEFMVGREVTFDGIHASGYVHDMFEGHEPEVIYAEHQDDDDHSEDDDHAEGEEAGHDDDDGHGEDDEHAEGEEAGHDDDDGHGGEGHGFMVLLAGTKDADGPTEATIKFTVTEEMVGEWEMGCFLEEGGHYDEGMIGKFVVKK